ncbi:MAG TPA: hypothetical protein VJ725_23420 [Thermoanaerobaculia bacterium]|nr:hypothetical protein [Thermoanaerobaculia bacterium]
MHKGYQKIGRHSTSMELPDIVHLKLVGEVSVDEGRAVNEAHLAYAKELPHFFYMIDLSELENIPAVVRKEASETVKLLPLRGTVIYQTPLKARVIAKLLLTAANLFRGGAGQNPVHFVDTAEEARDWIKRRRQRIADAA